MSVSVSTEVPAAVTGIPFRILGFLSLSQSRVGICMGFPASGIYWRLYCESGHVEGDQLSQAARLQRYAVVKEMRESGLSVLAVSLSLGVSEGSVRGLLQDPDGSKQKERRKRYMGVCLDCGQPTSGSNGYDKAPKRCSSCRWELQRAERFWTQEHVVAAIRRWESENGSQPVASDWIRAQDGYPSSRSVYPEPFGSWAEAVRAAGFETSSGRRLGDPVWDKETIIAAIRAWVQKTGSVPKMREWRWAQPPFPGSTSVAYYFGTWSAAIRAAGYTPGLV